jgi:AraC-like DNA-binding protein
MLHDHGTALRTTDLYEARRHLGEVIAPHRLRSDLPSARLEFLHRCARLPHFSIHQISYGAPVWLDVPSIPDIYVLQLMTSGEAMVKYPSGTLTMGPGTISVLNRERSFRKYLSRDAEQLMIRIDGALVRSVASTILPDEHDLSFDLTTINSAGLPMLTGMVRTLCEEVNSGARQASNASVSKQISDLLVTLLIQGFPHSGRHSETVGAVPYYVRRAETFVSQNASQDLTLKDICVAAGVARRTLCVGFRRFRKNTPMGHLRDVRLDQMRQLLTSAGDRWSVTAAAAECGLRHLGRLAQTYRNRFGELPSETLENARQKRR